MIAAAFTIIGRSSSSSSSHCFPIISRALTILHLPPPPTATAAVAQPILPSCSCYPQNSSSFPLTTTRYTTIEEMMTKSSMLAVTTTCTQLFLLIGGIQSFATPFNYHRSSNGLTIPNNTNDDKLVVKDDHDSIIVQRNFKLWSQATDKSSNGGGEAVLDLSEGRSTGSVLTDLVTNGVRPKDDEQKKEDCIMDDTTTITTTTTNGNTAEDDDVAEVITKQPIIITTTSTTTTTSSSSGTKIIATDDQFIKSDPDKRHYRAITLANQLTVLLTSDPMTDVESASVHVRAGHFDDPPNRAGLAHFHEHVRF